MRVTARRPGPGEQTRAVDRIGLISLTFEYTHVIVLLPRIGGRGPELASRAAFPRGSGSRQAGGCGGTGRAGGTTTCLRGRPKPQKGGRVRRPGPDVAPSGTMSAEPGDRGRIPARCGASRSTAFADRWRRAVTRFNTLYPPGTRRGRRTAVDPRHPAGLQDLKTTPLARRVEGAPGRVRAIASPPTKGALQQHRRRC
jgi:hypothetical protein